MTNPLLFANLLLAAIIYFYVEILRRKDCACIRVKIAAAGQFAEGAALSGAREGGRRLRMDVALENLVIEYRRCKASPPLRRRLNLSGQRTGCMTG